MRGVVMLWRSEAPAPAHCGDTGVQASASDCRRHADGWPAAECTCGSRAAVRLPHESHAERVAARARQELIRFAGAVTAARVSAGLAVPAGVHPIKRAEYARLLDARAQRYAAITRALAAGASPVLALAARAGSREQGRYRFDGLSRVRGYGAAPRPSQARKARAGRRAAGGGEGAVSAASAAQRAERRADAADLAYLNTLGRRWHTSTGEKRKYYKARIKSLCHKMGINYKASLKQFQPVGLVHWQCK